MTVLLVPGVDRADVAGTDHRLADALTQLADVVWVNPPVSVLRPRGRAALRSLPSSHSRDGLLSVVSTPALPFSTRPQLIGTTRWLQRARIRRFVRGRSAGPLASVCSHPLARLSHLPGHPRAFYLTDDFVAGATLMGLDPAVVRENVAANIEAADIVLAVSPFLADHVRAAYGREVEVLPNGCSLELGRRKLAESAAAAQTRAPGRSTPVALAVGQLNDRTDYQLLSDLLEAGVRLRIVGPVTDRVAARPDVAAILGHPHTDYRGVVPYDQLAQHFVGATLGITPYLDVDFNRASFPLKTLEYLSAGLPVVSTDLPASRWIGSELVSVAGTREEFVQTVLTGLARAEDDGEPAAAVQEACRAVAEQHTWQRRAEQLFSMLSRSS